ncbi:NAD-dependent epimerase/dehydratase family protein [Alkalitalea saponilacus]|uniref:Nucleoside-diphosphate-sugar epimerase n=1 Tax=Alkalitalea saponilacus TaxID=889453 RepID=A0A1T5GM60_9BACT|nr:NAD-dependent epimerase/dehydratase family protein [Alkalitalea saponilacus]ASB48277.1 3-beta hydroxysteroid dehydrogenase [Alkalitalea saponilacus]SKC09495.1 Nucleoside-diphosphate-sugar epimerase [Alkalitalea saponilacus]
MKILVTGIAGFIGSHLAERLLSHGHEVVGIDNFSDYYPISLKRLNQNDLESSGISIIEGDLRVPDDFKKMPRDFDCVFHSAAQPGISPTVTFEDYLSNNVVATQNLLDFALEMEKLEMFVNISTSSVYGSVATRQEHEATEPVSWYGVTKLAAEQLVMTQYRLGKLNACSLRLYSVYGPRERPDKLFTRLIDSGLNKKDFTLFEGSETHLRSFTYVGDIVDGMVAAIENMKQVNGKIINLGSEEERSTAEGIETVEKILHQKILIKKMSPRSGDQLRTHANIQLAKDILSYKPSTTLREGLEKQVQWYKQKFMQ